MIHDGAYKKKQQRAGLSEMGTHTYFLCVSNHSACDEAGTFCIRHKVPHLAVSTCQFSSQEESVSGEEVQIYLFTDLQLMQMLQNAFLPTVDVIDFLQTASHSHIFHG